MRFPHRSSICLSLCVTLFACGGLAHGQDATKSGGWQKVEAAEATRKYQEEAKAGTVGEQSVAWLRESVLPQLVVEGNRGTIERVRRRIHDVFLNEKSLDAAALEAANRIAGAAAIKLAMAPDAVPLARINAMLLVGELRDKDGRPWPQALQPLAAAIADAKLPPAVRIAAATGLARHADAARAAGGEEFGRVARPAIDSLIAGTNPIQDGAGADWLVSRALEILPVASPQASATTAAAVVKILNDTARPIDVRVRAAAALGATGGTDSKVDAGLAIATIRGLGISALEADIARAESRALDRALAGPVATAASGGGGQPTAEPSTSEPELEPLVIRRDAWRLAQLADAIARTDGQGLVRLLDANAAAAARFVADALRKAAGDLDAAPDLATCKRALEEIREVGGDAAAAKPAAGADKPASPFDN
jgi:hypothetical protein